MHPLQTTVRRPKTATNCVPVGDLCEIFSGSQGSVNAKTDFYGCQTAIGSGTLGNYAICDTPAYSNSAQDAQVTISKHGW